MPAVWEQWVDKCLHRVGAGGWLVPALRKSSGLTSPVLTCGSLLPCASSIHSTCLWPCLWLCSFHASYCIPVAVLVGPSALCLSWHVPTTLHFPRVSLPVRLAFHASCCREASWWQSWWASVPSWPRCCSWATLMVRLLELPKAPPRSSPIARGWSPAPVCCYEQRRALPSAPDCSGCLGCGKTLQRLLRYSLAGLYPSKIAYKDQPHRAPKTLPWAGV